MGETLRRDATRDQGANFPGGSLLKYDRETLSEDSNSDSNSTYIGRIFNVVCAVITVISTSYILYRMAIAVLARLSEL